MILVAPIRSPSLAKSRKVDRETALRNFDELFLSDPDAWDLNAHVVWLHLIKGSILQLYKRENVVEISATELRRSCGRAGHDLWVKTIYPAKQGHTTFHNRDGRTVSGHCSRYDAFGYLARILHVHRTRDRKTYEKIIAQIDWAIEQLASCFSTPLTWFVAYLRRRFSHVSATPAPTYIDSSVCNTVVSGSRGAGPRQPKQFEHIIAWLRDKSREWRGGTSQRPSAALVS